MLAGVRPFPGETVSDTLAAVLTAVPDWSRLPGGYSTIGQDAARRCLEKDPQTEAASHRRGADRVDDAGASEPAGTRAKPTSLALLAAVAGVALVLGALGGAA